ncbi:MAG: PepSY domain-containing protein [Thiobacillus sp.]
MYAPKITLALAAILLPVSVFASTECTKKPAEKWLSEKQAQAQLEKAGFTVQRIKRDDTCYEVYANRKDGKRVDLYINPVDASIVREKAK